MISKLCIILILITGIFGCENSTETNLNQTALRKDSGNAVQNKTTQWKEGDIILLNLESSQDDLIREATHSAVSHCAVVLKMDGQWMVAEAVQPVRLIPLNGVYSNPVYHLRLKDSTLLESEAIRKMREIALRESGKNYDIQFRWDDDEMYCSEFVWKMYHEAAGIDLTEPKPMCSYDLSSPNVKKEIARRYGVNPPLDELMVAPESFRTSPLLIEVY